jgi:hypothetical protein
VGTSGERPPWDAMGIARRGAVLVLAAWGLFGCSQGGRGRGSGPGPLVAGEMTVCGHPGAVVCWSGQPVSGMAVVTLGETSCADPA